MKEIWKPTTNKDNLHVVQDLRDKLDNNRINYNTCQSRLAKALNEIERLNSIEEDNKALRKVISRKNEKIKRITMSRDHLKDRYGVN